eukprot:SAG11_NODE_1247_length_5401_cov_2.372878_8_plen_77_part_00
MRLVGAIRLRRSGARVQGPAWRPQIARNSTVPIRSKGSLATQQQRSSRAFPKKCTRGAVCPPVCIAELRFGCGRQV